MLNQSHLKTAIDTLGKKAVYDKYVGGLFHARIFQFSMPVVSYSLINMKNTSYFVISTVSMEVQQLLKQKGIYQKSNRYQK